MYCAVVESPIGNLGLKTKENYLVSLHFLSKEVKKVSPSSQLAKEAVLQLSYYFNKKKVTFDLPISLFGTSFQLSIWNNLCTIPFGLTKTYSDIATNLATGSRAVGNACRHNPLPIIIPCHRVVAKGHIGGYSGARSGDLLAIKNWLLQHESTT